MSDVFSLLSSLERDAKLLISARALRSFIGGLVSVIFTIYLSKLGVLPLTMGFLFTVTSFIAAIRSFFEGILADRFGRKPFLLLLSGTLSVAGFIYAFSRNIRVLLCTAAISGLGKMYISSPSEQALLSEKTTDEERTTLFSIASFMGSISSMIGSFSAGIPHLFQTFLGFDEIRSYQPAFILIGLAALIGTLLYLPISEKREMVKSELSSPEDIREEHDETGKIIGRFSLVVAIDALGGSFIGSFLSYWFYIRFGVGPGKIGTLFGASRFLASLSYILGLKLAKNIGTINATVLSRLPVVGVNLTIPLVPSYTAAALLQGFKSAFSMIDVPLRQSYLMGVIKRSKRASAAGASSTVRMISATVAPTISGYLFQYVSIMFPFFVGASFQLASAVLLWLFFKDIKPPEERMK